MATLISLLLVSVAVALIVLVLTALPHLQAGPDRAGGFARLAGWFGLVFARIGESVGTGMDALGNGPSARRRKPVVQHGPASGYQDLDEPADEQDRSGIGPRHAAR